jgi:hypothetical protein
MTTWTPAELSAIDSAGELDIATRRSDGTLRGARIVWVVRHDDQLYVRSVNGRDAAWYRGVQTRHAGHISAGGVEKDVTFIDADHTLDDDLDAAYRAKYGSSSAVTHITADIARATTLRLDPA